MKDFNIQIAGENQEEATTIGMIVQDALSEYNIGATLSTDVEKNEVVKISDSLMRTKCLKKDFSAVDILITTV